MKETEKTIQEQLFELQDSVYRDFCSKLTPSIDKETIIGIRIPALRKFARELSKKPEAANFMKTLPHRYYEENNLHGFLIERIKDYDGCVDAIDTFLPYVDNWATCDLMSPKIFKKHLPQLIIKIEEWIRSNCTYTIRFGVGMLMSFYLDDDFETDYPKLVANLRSDEYYVNMMIAWYFATALSKQYDAALPYIEHFHLDRWTHNKAIQKAIESCRISNDRKAYLRTLKIK